MGIGLAQFSVLQSKPGFLYIVGGGSGPTSAAAPAWTCRNLAGSAVPCLSSPAASYAIASSTPPPSPATPSYAPATPVSSPPPPVQPQPVAVALPPEKPQQHSWVWDNVFQKKCDPDCQKKIDGIRFLIDDTVDPCNDFFQFACSEKNRQALARGRQAYPYAREKIGTKNLVSYIESAEGSFSFLKNFYKSCVDIVTDLSVEDALTSCLEDDGVCTDEELKKLAGNNNVFIEFREWSKKFSYETSWPSLTKDWEDTQWAKERFTWEKQSELILNQQYFLGAIQYERGGTERFMSNVFFAPMIDHTVYSEDLLKVNPRIKVKQQTSSLLLVPMTFPKFLINDDKTAIEKYRVLMRNIMKLLGADQIVGKDVAEKDIENVILHEMELAKLSKYEYVYDKSHRQELKENFTRIEIGDLENLLRVVGNEDFSLIDYVNSVLNNPDVKVNATQEVFVPSLDVMNAMYSYINKMAPREQSNLLLWRVFAKLGDNFFQAKPKKNSFYENIFEEDGKVTSRKNNCINQVKTFFPKIFDDLIIDKYLSENEKEDIIKMFGEIKTEFSNILNSNSWMGEKTKETALKKLNKMRINVGNIVNDQRSEIADKIRSGASDYIPNILLIGNSFWQELVTSLNKPKDAFYSPEAGDNAFYSPGINEVQVNVGLLKGSGVGISSSLPRALLYGGLVASTLGHELTHGFDNSGRRFDQNGNWR